MLRESSPIDLRDTLKSRDTPSNRLPYRRNPFHRTIDHLRVYFYYFTDPTTGSEPIPKVYVYDHYRPLWNRQKVEEIVEDLTVNAATGGNQPEQVAEGFDAVPWTKISLVAIVMDNPLWQFISGKAIFFEEREGREGNHSFFDAFDFDVPFEADGAGRLASALCFTNHMVDAYGNDLAHGQREKFKYTLCVRNRQSLATIDIDPGGTNLGPPVPPP